MVPFENFCVCLNWSVPSHCKILKGLRWILCFKTLRPFQCFYITNLTETTAKLYFRITAAKIRVYSGVHLQCAIEAINLWKQQHMFNFSKLLKICLFFILRKICESIHDVVMNLWARYLGETIFTTISCYLPYALE